MVIPFPAKKQCVEKCVEDPEVTTLHCECCRLYLDKDSVQQCDTCKKFYHWKCVSPHETALPELHVAFTCLACRGLELTPTDHITKNSL